MATATDNGLGTVVLAGDLMGSSNGNSPELTPTGVKPGTYTYPRIYVDSKGRILEAFGGEAEAPPAPCATTDSCGAVQIGQNIDVDAQSKISIPFASETAYGVVKYGSGFVETDCGFEPDTTLKVASKTQKGIATISESDGLAIDDDSIISTTPSSVDKLGVVQIGTTISVNEGIINLDNISPHLPNATTTSKGIVQVGSGLEVTDGVIEVEEDHVFILPPNATTTSKGIVQVGSGLEVTDGIIEVPVASNVKAGIVKIGTSFNSNETLSYTTNATADDVGLVKLGPNFSVTDDILSHNLPNATTTSKGIVQVGSGLEVTDGVIEVPVASNVKAGIVKIGTGLEVTDGVVNVDISDLIQESSHVDKGIFSYDPNTITLTNDLKLTPVVATINGDVATPGIVSHTSVYGYPPTDTSGYFSPDIPPGQAGTQWTNLIAIKGHFIDDKLFQLRSRIGAGFMTSVPMSGTAPMYSVTVELGEMGGRYPIIYPVTFQYLTARSFIQPGALNSNDFITYIYSTQLTRINFIHGHFAPTLSQRKNEAPERAIFYCSAATTTIPFSWGSPFTYQQPNEMHPFTYTFQPQRTTTDGGFILSVQNTTIWKFPSHIDRLIIAPFGMDTITLTGIVTDNKIYVQDVQFQFMDWRNR